MGKLQKAEIENRLGRVRFKFAAEARMDKQIQFEKRVALTAARRSKRNRDTTLVSNALLPSLVLLDVSAEISASNPTPLEADTLIRDIRQNLTKDKFADLLEACQRECLQAVIRPFGVARLLFEDKLGGNVTTIHNVRSEEYRSSNNTSWAETGEKLKYETSVKEFDQKKKEYKNYVKSLGVYQEALKKWENEGRVGESPVRPAAVLDPKYAYREGHENYKKKESTIK